jgi:hypothetical protein
MPQATGSGPGDLLVHAMNNGASMEQLEKLLDLKMRHEANEARKDYVAAMAEFKKNPPTILKDKAVGYTNKDGTFTGYKHATLGNVTNAIVEGLAAHGFSHNWVVRQNNGIIEVDCTITHRAGHSEKVTMQATKDDSGKKNAIQQVASAVTYLQRYTLLLATGLATHDQADDDAEGMTTDTSLADEWIAKLADCADDASVVALWQPAVKAFAKDKLGLKEFEAAFVERRTKLAEGGAA